MNVAKASMPFNSQTNISTSSTMAKPPETATTTRWQRCLQALPPRRAVLTVVASVVLEATLGVTYTYGNLLPYVTSYMRNVTGETSVDYAQMLWHSNSMWLVLSATIVFFGLVERRIPNRIYVSLGISLNAVALFGTYWAVQTSFVLLVVVNGVVQGLAQAILYPNAINLALKWFPHHKGVVGGITMGGYGGGAFIWNQIVTSWINPHNLQPDLLVGQNRYFTQPELLIRVPTCYLVLGGILISIQLVCLLSSTYPDTHPSSLTLRVPEKYPPNPDHIGVNTKDADTELEDCSKVDDVENVKGSSLGEKDFSTQNLELKDVSIVSEDTVITSPDYSPLAILRSRVTWLIWLNNLSLDFAFIFIVSFYKAYGQTFILDDHMLSLVASFASVFNAIGRPFWGLVADRIGYLPALLLTQGILLVTSATFITTELAGSSAMFFVWVCAMFAAFSGVYALQGPILFTLFGARSFIFAVGVISSTGIIATLASVPLTEVMMAAVGWKGLFLMAASFVLLGVSILAFVLLPCGHPIPSHMRIRLMVPMRFSSRTGQ